MHADVCGVCFLLLFFFVFELGRSEWPRSRPAMDTFLDRVGLPNLKVFVSTQQRALVEAAIQGQTPVPSDATELKQLYEYDVPILGPEGTCRHVQTFTTSPPFYFF
jgi:hypothetical protein